MLSGHNGGGWISGNNGEVNFTAVQETMEKINFLKTIPLP
jgi:hypothetical protein